LVLPCAFLKLIFANNGVDIEIMILLDQTLILMIMLYFTYNYIKISKFIFSVLPKDWLGIASLI